MHRMCNIDSKHTTECLAEQATRAEQTKSANVSDHNLQMEKTMTSCTVMCKSLALTAI